MPQLEVEVDRVKAETLQVSVGDVFAALSAYLGSTYVNQFNKFGRTFQVYVQADSPFRLQPAGHREALRCAASRGNMMSRWARWCRSRPTIGPSLISLYNLYPAATDRRQPGAPASAPGRR